MVDAYGCYKEARTQPLLCFPIPSSIEQQSSPPLRRHVFSLIIALQVSNEVHRSIKHPYRRMQAQHNTNLRFTIACLSLLLVSVFLSWVIDLILLSGDVHPNPGPDSVSSLADTSTSSSISTLGALSNHLSIMHLKIRSILPKLDLIKCKSLAYDVLVFTKKLAETRN